MQDDLAAIVEGLREGLRLSQQGGYQRRAPAAAAVPHLKRARGELGQLVQEDPGRADAWQWLSLACEALLDYDGAAHSLEQVRRLRGTLDRKELKRLARLREATDHWARMPLSPVELKELGRFLEERVTPSDVSFSHTERWLRDRGVVEIERTVERLEELGVRSDFELLYNVIRG